MMTLQDTVQIATMVASGADGRSQDSIDGFGASGSSDAVQSLPKFYDESALHDSGAGRTTT